MSSSIVDGMLNLMRDWFSLTSSAQEMVAVVGVGSCCTVTVVGVGSCCNVT
ncbi:14230_t:CDS:1, partial [Acaulospora morrowiae]